MSLPIPAGVIGNTPQIIKGNAALAELMDCDEITFRTKGLVFNDLLSPGHRHSDARKLRSLPVNQSKSEVFHFCNTAQPLVAATVMRKGRGNNTLWYIFPERSDVTRIRVDTYRDHPGTTTGMVQVDYNNGVPVIKELNNGFVKLTGYAPSNLYGKELKVILPDYFDKERRSKLEISLNERRTYYQQGFVRTSDGRLISVFILVIPVIGRAGDLGTNLCFFIPLLRNDFEKDTIDPLSTIVKKAPACASLSSMGKMIHQTLNKKISASNFYVSLFNKDSGLWGFPYYCDTEHSESPTASVVLEGSLTELVFHLGKGMIVTPERYKKLRQIYKLKPHGKPAAAWLGVPLKSKGKILGVMAIQSYHKGALYSDNDLLLMKNISGIVATLVERQQITEKLIQSEQQFKRLSSTIPIGYWLASYPALTIQFKNHYFDLLLGITKDSCGRLTDGSCLKWMIPEDRKRLTKLLSGKHVLKKFSQTFRLYTHQGLLKWVNIAAFPVKRKGTITQVAGFIADVTDFESSRREKEVLFNISEAANRRITDIRTISRIVMGELTALWNISSFSVSIYDQENRELIPKSAYSRSSGRSMKNMKQMSDAEQLLANEVMKTKKALLFCEETFQEDKAKRTTSKKKQMFLSWMGAPLKGDGNTIGVITVGSDHKYFRFSDSDLSFLKQIGRQYTIVLERQIMQQAVVQREIYFRKLTENSNDLCILLDKAGVIQYISPSCNHIFGWRPEQLTGRNVLSLLHSDDARVARQLLDDWQRGMNLKAKNVFRLRHKKNELRFISLSGNNLLKDPVIGGIVINGHDITNEHLSRVQLSEINTELDTFVYRASHDLKGPLASIMGLLQMSEKEVTDPPASTYLEMIKTSAGKLDNVLTDLLAITRIKQGKLDLKYINLFKMVQEVFERLRHKETYEGIELKCDIDKELKFRSDKRLLDSILQNLIENAMKYHKAPNRVKSRWIWVQVLVNNYSLNLTISDNGPGMKKEIKERIFEMFFRGNEASDGTGLGLYIVKNAVRKLKGNVVVKSIPKKGTTFEVRLPKII